jgi:hypothetical protein
MSLAIIYNGLVVIATDAHREEHTLSELRRHGVNLYGVVSDFLEEAVELFPAREEAEAVVHAGIGTSSNQAATSAWS